MPVRTPLHGKVIGATRAVTPSALIGEIGGIPCPNLATAGSTIARHGHRAASRRHDTNADHRELQAPPLWPFGEHALNPQDPSAPYQPRRATTARAA